MHGDLIRVGDADAARTLADLLNGSSRSRPVVVVTTPAGRSEPWIDAEEIQREVGDLAEVYLMETGPHTWEFSHGMEEGTQVYGGAGRVYPVGHGWVTDLRESPLRFAYDQAEGTRRTADLIGDVYRMALAAGLLAPARTAARTRPATGLVKGFPHPERALVELDDGSLATVVPDLAVSSVPLRRCVAPGMRVEGTLDPESRRLDLRSSRRNASVSLASYVAGSLVLAEVTKVSESCATLRVHPDVTVVVSRDEVTSNPLDSLTSLMTVGEVLAAHVVAVGPAWALSLVDVDDDEEPIPAAALFEAGPPWLELPDLSVDAPIEAEDEPVPAPTPTSTAPAVMPELVATPPAPEAPAEPRPSPLLLDPKRRREQTPAAPVPATAPADAVPALTGASGRAVHDMSLTISALQRETERLRVEVAALSDERQLLAHQLREAQGERARALSESQSLRARLRKKTRRSVAAADVPVFADRERGFRHAVEAAWARRTPPGEQAARPLPDYDVGPEFVATLGLEGISEVKVADVVFEVLSGLAKDLPGRELHPLRTSKGGDSPQASRLDGAMCWRVSLQVNTASARRLHYWRLPGGRVELSRVVLHDDMTP